MHGGLALTNTTCSSDGGPAGPQTHAEGQQPVGVLVETARDQRVLDWLIEQAGIASIETVVNALAGRRRPYVSNVAKELGLTPPTDLVFPPPNEAQRHLAHCKAILIGTEK